MTTAIEAMKQALAAGKKFIAKAHAGKVRSIETYNDLMASNKTLIEAIAQAEAQTVEPVGCMRCNTPKKCAAHGCSPNTWPSEHPALPTSAERETLLAELHYAHKMTTDRLFKKAHDMLAADGQEMCKLQAQPQAEMTDDDLNLIWRKSLAKNHQAITNIPRVARWFARAVLAAQKSK